MLEGFQAVPSTLASAYVEFVLLVTYTQLSSCTRALVSLAACNLLLCSFLVYFSWQSFLGGAVTLISMRVLSLSVFVALFWRVPSCFCFCVLGFGFFLLVFVFVVRFFASFFVLCNS